MPRDYMIVCALGHRWYKALRGGPFEPSDLIPCEKCGAPIVHAEVLTEGD